MSRTAQAVELDLSQFAGRVPVELSGGAVFPMVGQLSYLLTLPPYGFYWFALSAEAEPPSLEFGDRRSHCGTSHLCSAPRSDGSGRKRLRWPRSSTKCCRLMFGSGAGFSRRTKPARYSTPRIERARRRRTTTTSSIVK